MSSAKRILRLTAALLLPVLWLSTPATSTAQSGEQLREFIIRTGEIIDLAADLVFESENQQARRILAEARGLHQRSQHHMERNQPQLALQFSRRARTAAQHAARLARETHNQQERFQLRFERFDELRDQLRERVREADDDRARRFLQEGEQQAVRARAQLRQGNLDLALHLMKAAEDLLARTTRLLFEGTGSERLEREFERTYALLERTAEQLEHAAGPQRAAGADLLQSAAEALRRAEEHRERRQTARALHSLHLARQLAAQAAASDAVVTTDPEAVAHQLARWDKRLELVAEQVRTAESPAAAAILERARHHRELAGRHLAAGDLEPALRQLRAAFDLLNEASGLTR